MAVVGDDVAVGQLLRTVPKLAKRAARALGVLLSRPGGGFSEPAGPGRRVAEEARLVALVMGIDKRRCTDL